MTMAQAHTTTPAAQQIQFRLSDISLLTARLAQVLAEEVDLLNAMKVSQIEALQKEKQFLISALEMHKKNIAKNPHLVESIPSQDRDEFASLTDVFQDILQENHRKLQLAKEVNQYVVKAITKVVQEHSASRYYNHMGTKPQMQQDVLSVTLNKTI